MSYEKFKVERLVSTLSGTYAVYYTERGEAWTGNFNFNPGDIVEWWDYDGYCPSKIIVNGIVTWTEEDKKEWWNRREFRHNEKMREICREKDIYHSKYNNLEIT